MAIITVPLINFPLSAVVDGIISYIQFLFGNPDITPAEYRWSSDDRQSRIRISGVFVLDNQKPMSAPFIVVERGAFNFANRTLDNLKNGTENAMETTEHVDWCDGSINIICGSGVAGEASSIANYIALSMQSDRHGIMSTLRFVRNMYYIDVSPEIPVVKDTEIRRWEVTLRIFVSLQMGWVKTIIDPLTKWEKAAIKTISDFDSSETGIVVEGSDLLVDVNKNFGTTVGSDPQLLAQELSRKWYYIKFSDNDELFPVSEIVDSHTLRLLHHDEDNNPIPWSCPESESDVSYSLLWNSVHIYMELPKP